MTVTKVDENTQPGVSRRVLARGAAWTVPAVAIAAAAPSIAASPLKAWTTR